MTQRAGLHLLPLLLAGACLELLFLSLSPVAPAAPAHAADPTFAERRNFGTGLDDTQSVAVGDMDGDGDLDLVIGNFRQQNVVYLNDGSGNFNGPGSARNFGTGLDDTQSVAVGDVDGDGDLDLVTGNYGQQNVVYLNDGAGNFNWPGSARNFGTGSDLTRSVAVGDVDGDGDLDIVTGKSGFGEQNAVYLNDGAGNFDGPGSARNFGTGSDFTYSVAVGDMDGDGDLDLVTGNSVQDVVYLNDGAGNFDGPGSARNFGTGPDFTPSVAVGDVDSDGDLDLVTSNTVEQDVVYLNDGTGNFNWPGSARNFGTGSDNTRSVAVGDVDGDGDLDLVTGNFGRQNVVYLNDGAGNFDGPGSARNFGTGSDNTTSVPVGDVDGDGDLDLVTGNVGHQSVVYLNDGAGNFPNARPYTRTFGTGSDNTSSVAVGDVDGDGDLDLVTGNFGQQSVVYLNDEAGNFDGPGSARNFGTGSENTRSVAVGDVDGDGDLDLVTGNDGQQNVVYLNDGVGNFDWPGSTRNFGTGSDDTTSVAVGDVDGDSDLDLVTANILQQNVVYLNDGAGNFDWPGSARNFGTGLDTTQSVAVGDVDGDGDLDLVTGNDPLLGYSGQDVVYLNDGVGNFVWPGSARNFGTGTDRTLSVAVGDVDGDGDLDLVTGNSGQDVVYLNDGVGNFDGPGSARYFGTGTESTESVAVGDVDGDGELDIVTRNNGQQDVVYLNDGAGNFDGPGSARDFGTSPIGTRSVAVGDVDGDGDLDLVTGNLVQQNMVYLNAVIGSARLANNPAWVGVSRPGPTRDGNFYSSPAILDGPTIPVIYTLFDPEGDPVRFIRAFYSLNGGDNWLPAVATTGTLTTNLSTTNLFTHTHAVSPATSIPDPGTLTSTLALTPTDLIADLDVWLNLTHTTDSDLVVTLTAPFSRSVVLVNGRGGSGADFIETTFDDEATTSIISGTAPFTGRFRSEQALSRLDGNPIMGTWTLSVTDQLTGNSGALMSWGITATLKSGVVHTYTWDTLASGFFGQSDNVVFRIEAYPVPFSTTLGITGTYRYTNTLPGAFQRPYASATSFPFRVRGTQVRVISDTVPSSNALVYRLPAGQPVGGALMSNGAGNAFHTDAQGYLQGRGQINIGDQLLALVPITYTDSYTLYYTNGAPNLVGLDTYTVTTSGVQTLTVSSAHPLILFDLEVALEWDASQDPTYRQQLEFDLKRASQSLYDFTNGQAALGHITVHQNADDWVFSHVVVHATNHLRPFAAQGGVVITTTVDPQHPDIVYDIGQVHMGATWNRYGTPGQSLGEDWPLILAHELSHYLFYLDDAYLGLNPDGLLIAVGSCSGSAMGDTYVPDNTEFVGDDGQWNANCANTLSNQTLGRNEWETIRLWYPTLISPTVGNENPGPSLVPFNFTTVSVQDPITPTAALADPTFYLDYANGEVSSSEARAFLLRDDQYVIDLGSPFGGQNRLLARGAQPGDRLCVFDRPRQQYGCEIVALGDERLGLEQSATWTPVIQITPVTTQTFDIRVESLPGGLPLRARLYPEFGPGETPITLTEASGVYSGTFSLTYPALAGNVQVWVNETATETNPRREAMLAYTIGGNPGNQRSGIGETRGGGGNQRSGIGNQRSGIGSARSGGAPLVSPDGQMIFFTANPIIFNEGDFYTVQDMAGLPPLPPGKIAIGQGHNLVASPSAPVLTGTVSFQYLGNDVLVEGANENELTIHFWDGRGWRALPTVRDPYFNLASARSEGPGVYALLAGVTTPTITALNPSSATNEVTRTVVIGGGYFLPPVQVELIGPAATYTLPIAAVSPISITAVITQGLPAGEYQVVVINGDGGASPAPGVFALYDPADACFYDFFESGAGQWQLEGEWGIVNLPSDEQAMTDSPAGNYASAILPAATRTTSITSQPFSLASCAHPVLTFRHDYVLARVGASQDVGRVEILTDGGVTWTELASYTGGGIYGASAQDVTDSEWTAVNWKRVGIDLSAYTGSSMRLRFSLMVDQNVSDKGWVIDDVFVQSGPPTHYLYLPLVMRNASGASAVPASDNGSKPDSQPQRLRFSDVSPAKVTPISRRVRAPLKRR